MITPKKEAFVLLLGDVVALYIALWIMLATRYQTIPAGEILHIHAKEFSIVFVVWLVVFFISGLYEKHTLLFKSKIPSLILRVQAINSILAVGFFYFLPYFSLTPKTNLFIYIILSFGLLVFWRLYGVSFLGIRKKNKAIIIGSGGELKELKNEVNSNPRYNLYFVSSVDLDEIDGIDFEKEILSVVYSEDIHTVVIDLKNEKVAPILPHLYNLVFSKVRFVDKHRVYEEIFDRIPLSLIGYSWFLENISSDSKHGYDIVKRLIDVVSAIVTGVVSLVFYPFVFVALKMQDGGSLFIRQTRVGKDGHPIQILKFRSMKYDDREDENLRKENHITKVGEFIRKTRIDELPQLWNVLKGDLSFIGPRPELPNLVKKYENEVPYYNVRHLVKPGLSGWAQIYHKDHPHLGANVEETKMKLSYDLFYLKNHSFVLDVKIFLRTIQILFSRVGR